MRADFRCIFVYLDDLERLRCLSLLPTHDLPMFKIMIMLPACVKALQGISQVYWALPPQGQGLLHSIQLLEVLPY
jgi:hypothetical protein